MMPNFLLGFHKQANKLLDAARSGMRAGGKLKNVAAKVENVAAKAEGAVERVHNYATHKAPLDSMPVWKKKMIEQGKKPVGVDARQMPQGVPHSSPNPVNVAEQAKDIHQHAAEELARRGQMVARGGHTHTQWQEAMAEAGKKKLG